MASQPVTVDFDLGVYPLSAIKKASYKFGGRAFIEISRLPDDDGTARVTLTPMRSLENVQHLAGEFRNEVLDQELREAIAHETESIRNVLIAQAFSATALLDPVGESGDPESDPLHIRHPDQGLADGEAI